MRVICRKNQSPSARAISFGRIPPKGLGDCSYPVQEDKEYLVYAVMFTDRQSYYYVLDEDADFFFHPASLFDVVDGRLSRYWCFGVLTSYEDKIPTDTILLAYPQMAQDLSHFRKLLEYEPDSRKIFNEYRIKLEAEF